MALTDSDRKIIGAKIVEDLREYIEAMGSGAAKEREIIPFMIPEEELFLGCIFPKERVMKEIASKSKKTKAEKGSESEETVAIQIPDESVLPNDDEDEQEADDSDSKEGKPPTTSVRPYGMSINFLSKPTGKIDVIPRLRVYYRVLPNFEEYKKSIQNQYANNVGFDVNSFISSALSTDIIEHPQIWERVDIDLASKQIDLASPTSENYDPMTFRIRMPKRELLKESDQMQLDILKGGQSEIDKFWRPIRKVTFPDWRAKLKLTDNGPMPGQPIDYHMFTLTFMNTSVFRYQDKGIIEATFFDCRLEVQLDKVDHRAIDHEWEYELPYSAQVTHDQPPKPFEIIYPMFSWGNGCFPEYDSSTKRIITKVTNSVQLSRVSPLDVDNTSFSASLKFSSLILNPVPSLERIAQELQNNESEYEKLRGNLKADCDISQFNIVRERYNEGLDLIKSDAKVRKAFSLMNETYMNAYGNDKGWRLFQIAFIVGNIKQIFQKINRSGTSCNENAQILFVSTGGGKTEAYVGLTIFLLFYQRLIGQAFGIATWVKFPLRLLALDQFDRLTKMIIWADKIKKDKGINGEPFSLGFFVGSDEQFPASVAKWVVNRMQEQPDVPGWKPKIFSRNLKDNEEKGALLEECPICRKLNGTSGDYKWTYVPTEHRVRHWCDSCKTEFFIYITGEEVSRYLPSIIVSTVDKLAAGAWRPYVGSLLGAQLFKCDHHGFSITDKQCPIMDTRCGNDYLNSPSFGNGTYAFNSSDGAFRNQKCNIRPRKVQSNTHAPILMIQDELHLLNENLGTTDSYFETLTDWIIQENTDRLPLHICMSATLAGARKQVGLLYLRKVDLWPGDAPTKSPLKLPPNDAFFLHSPGEMHRVFMGMMPHGKTPDFCTYRCLQFAWYRTQQYVLTPSILANVLIKSSLSFNTSDLTDFVKNYYTKSFVYQGRKIGTHGLANSIDKIVNPDIDRFCPLFRPIIFDTATGDNSMDEIRDIRRRISKGGNLDVLISTSLISHGVDLTNVNQMYFQGFPSSASEFIQASSRIGRAFPGLVLVSFYPTRSRDIELSADFKMYLETMRYWVEPVSISRYCSQALKEVIVTAICFALTSHGQELLSGSRYTSSVYPYDVHQVGNPRSGAATGYLNWRLLEPTLDDRLNDLLLKGLGLTNDLMSLAPFDILPPTVVISDLTMLFNTLIPEFRNTLITKMTPSMSSNYTKKQLAKFCLDVLGSPQKEDGTMNVDFVDRWYQCMTGLRGIQAPVDIKLTSSSNKYLGGK